MRTRPGSASRRRKPLRGKASQHDAGWLQGACYGGGYSTGPSRSHTRAQARARRVSAPLLTQNAAQGEAPGAEALRKRLQGAAPCPATTAIRAPVRAGKGPHSPSKAPAGGLDAVRRACRWRRPGPNRKRLHGCSRRTASLAAVRLQKAAGRLKFRPWNAPERGGSTASPDTGQ